MHNPIKAKATILVAYCQGSSSHNYYYYYYSLISYPYLKTGFRSPPQGRTLNYGSSPTKKPKSWSNYLVLMVKTISGEDEGNRSVMVEISSARGHSSSSTKKGLRSTRGRLLM